MYPNKRLNAGQALKHPWLASKARLSYNIRLIEIATRLILYAESGEFKKIVMQVIVKRTKTKDILELLKIFNEFDRNKDKTITFCKFKETLPRPSL